MNAVENKSKVVPIEQVKPWDKNPREVQGKDFARLKRQIKKFGVYKPLIVYAENGGYIALGGNMRIRALKELGQKEVWVSEVEPKSKQERIEISLSDNDRVGRYSEQELAELIFPFKDTLDLGDFKVDISLPDMDLSGILDSVAGDAGKEDDYKEPETLPSKVKAGEIWQLGKHRLMCGSSVEKEDVDKLMNGEKADMVFTDPPYGMSLETDYTDLSWGDRKGKKYDRVIGDNNDFKPEIISSIFDNFGYCEEMFLWGADYYFELVPNFKAGNYIVWDKTLKSNGDAGSNSEYELLWSKKKHKRTVVHFNWFRFFGLSDQDIRTREHPTQKPLQVITPFLTKHSKEGNIISDIYLGSGSTLIACEQTGRICNGMEVDPHYCDVIIDRWETYTGKRAECL